MNSSFNKQTVRLSGQTVHLLDNFDCGHDEINRYVKEDALNNMTNGNGVTYLVIDSGENKLIAYYTLAATSILNYQKDVSGKDDINEVKIYGYSAIEIKMFAVSKVYQDFWTNDGIVLSDIILGELIGDIYTMSYSLLGIKVIFLNAINEDNVINFYERNTFEKLSEYMPLYNEYNEGCVPMYLPLYELD